MASPPAPTVILVPGLWMPGMVLLPWQRRLEAAGYRVRRFPYPSWGRGLDANVDALASALAATPGAPVHLVGHSLGGLLILALLARGMGDKVGRAVLLGSPARGSHSGSRLLASASGRFLVGQSLTDWLAAPPPSLPPGMDIGVIAGTRSLGLGRLLGGLPRPNDGAVTVVETRLAAATDFITVDVSHSGMLVSATCAAQVASFLASGRFGHGE